MEDAHSQRVIALIDMDCFYVQVEERDNPSLRGKPCCVVQYKPYRGGGIIAINYEARAKGVRRGMMGDDAKEACPEVQIVFVKETRGKADLTKYRAASSQVFQALSSHCSHVERASVDEAFLDLTSLVEKRLAHNIQLSPIDAKSLPTTRVLMPENSVSDSQQCKLEDFLETANQEPSRTNAQLRLAVGAQIVEEIRESIFARTEFRCSAGIAHNKILAKLACGVNKPNKQTIFPHISVKHYFSSLPVHKLRYLGGKLGDIVQEELGCTHVGDLLKYADNVLTNKFGNRNGLFLYNICRGFNFEPVKPRTTVMSIGCSKNFLGKESIWTEKETAHWILQLCTELEERLNEDVELNQRVFKVLTVSFSVKRRGQFSKRCPITSYDSTTMHSDVMKTILSHLPFKITNLERFPDPIIHLGTYASKTENAESTSSSIINFFSATADKSHTFSSFNSNTKSSTGTMKKPKAKKSALDLFLDRRKVQSSLFRNCNSEFGSSNAKTSPGLRNTMGSLPILRNISEKTGSLQMCEACEDTSTRTFREDSIVFVPESPPEVIESFPKTDSSFLPLNPFHSSWETPNDLMICTPVKTASSVFKDFNSFTGSSELDGIDDGKNGDFASSSPSHIASILFDESDASCDSSAAVKSPQIGPVWSNLKCLRESAITAHKNDSNESAEVVEVATQPTVTPKQTNTRKRPQPVSSERKPRNAKKQLSLKITATEKKTMSDSKKLISSKKSRPSPTIETMFEKMSYRNVPEDIYVAVEGNEDFMKCVLCLNEVSMFDVLTHRDFHVAEKLQLRYQSSSMAVS